MPTHDLLAPTDLGADLLTVVARLNRMATQQSDLPMPYAQARLLAQIEQQGPSRNSELAAADHCSQPTMTTQVQRLEAGGWAARRRDPTDARAVLITPTPRVQELIHDLVKEMAAVETELRDSLGEDELRVMRRCLSVLWRSSGAPLV